MQLLAAGKTRDEVREETGAVAAVIDASLTIEPGEVFVVMGLSGSGKSTLVRTINRLFEPTSGRVIINGTDITDLSGKELRAVRSEQMSMVFQHFALMPHRTVLDNAAWGLEARRVSTSERRERALEALQAVGLADRADAFPGQLSGGMQQRVGLARALATESNILLMDEAFSALDPLIRREMQDQMIELQENLGKTVVFITHDLNEAMRIGDRIAVMKDGRIVQIGTAEDILTDPANDYVASFIQDVDRSQVLTASSVMEPPIATLGAHEGPRAAMRIMRENQLSGLFVLGQGRRLRGTVSDEDVTRAVRDSRSIDDILTTEVYSVGPDTPLADVLAPAAESTLPLAVLGEEQRLVGVIPRVTLLAALAGDNGDPTPTDTASTDTASTDTVATDTVATDTVSPETPAEHENPEEAADA